MIAPADRVIPADALDAARTDRAALLLWDLQEGLGGHALGRDALVPRWIALRDAARRAGVPILRSRHVAVRPELMPDTELWRLMRKQGVGSPSALRPYMQPDGADVRFLPGLEPGPDEIVIDKRTPSLFVGTDAEALIRATGARALVMAGVATDIGIAFTARHALALGLFPVVVEDACGAYTDEAQQRGIKDLRSLAFTTEADPLIRSWNDV